MPNSTINANTSGLNSTAGNANALDLQVAGSTVASVTSSGVAVTGTLSSTGVSSFPAGSNTAPSITFTGDTNTGIYSSGADTVVVVTDGTAAQTIDSGQRTKFPTTIGVGAATPSTSGSGVSFPATQSASTDANTLDDYEEGTWSPILTPASGTITVDASIKTGAYTKVGRVVTVTGNIVFTSSTPSGSITLSGLPFSVDGSITANGERFAGGVFLSGWSSGNGYGAVLVDSGTSGSLQTSIAGTPIADASFEIYISFSYFTA